MPGSTGRAVDATVASARASRRADLFIGRDWEREEVAEAIAGAAAQQGELVLISGEAGIGKTRLARQAISDVRGCAVLWAACWAGDDGPPYWPWMQVARALADAIDLDAETTVHVDRHALSVLAPELSDEPGLSDHRDHAAERVRLFDAVLGLLSAVAVSRPVIVVFDDLHAADEPSLALLRHVASRLASLPVSIIGTYRAAEVRADPSRAAAFAALGRGARTVPLVGLTEDELRRLVSQTINGEVPAEWLANLARRTGGNPFFAKEVLRLLAARGGGAGTSLASVPPSVVEVVVQRVARLPQAVAALLELAAVIGERFGVDDITVVGREPRDVLDALDVASRAGLVTPAADRFGFSHALVREAIYENLGPVRRAQLHQEVGLALEDAHGSAEMLAHHFLAAVPAGETERAVRYAVLAGEAALTRLAHEDAGAWFDHAVELTASDDEELALRALLGRAEVRRRAGDAAAALADLFTVAAAARRGRCAPVLARAALGVQRLGFTSGQLHAEPIELLEDAQHALADDEPELRALVLSALATELWEHARGRETDARSLSVEALDLAERSGVAATLARCLEARYTIAWTPDSAGERVAIAERMTEVARASGDAELHATAQLLLATALLELADQRWMQALDRFFELGTALHLPRVDYLVETRRAARAILQGHRDDAAAMIEEASALGERIGEPDAAPVEFYLRWELARFAGTRAALHDATRPRPRTTAVSLAGHVWTPLMLLDAGKTERALAAFHRAARIPLDDVRRDWIFLNNVFDLAEAAVRLGVTDIATGCYDTLLPYAGRVSVVSGFVCCCGAVDHHLGILALELGNGSRAVEHLRAAVTIHERIGAAAWARASHDLLERARATSRVTVGSLVREGKVWRITWRGVEAHVPDAKGIRDLAVLFERPREEIHAGELYRSGTPGAVFADSRGEAAVDESARAAYRSRLAEIERELMDAATNHDIGRAERGALERDALIDELRRNFDMKGRSRRLGDTTERARKAVSARLRDAIALIEQAHPHLGTHLRDTVRTGTYCSYEPADTITWTVRQI